MRVPHAEAALWVAGFQTLQGLRLQVQCTRVGAADVQQRAWVPWAALGADARLALKQALRAARLVQQRIELDYCR